MRVRDAASSEANLTTVSGDVEVGIHAGTLAAIDLTTVSGSTISDFEVSDEAPQAGSKNPVATDGRADSVIRDESDIQIDADTLAATDRLVDGGGLTDPAPTDPGSPADGTDPTGSTGSTVTDNPEPVAATTEDSILALQLKTTSGEIRRQRSVAM